MIEHKFFWLCYLYYKFWRENVKVTIQFNIYPASQSRLRNLSGNQNNYGEDNGVILNQNAQGDGLSGIQAIMQSLSNINGMPIWKTFFTEIDFLYI